MPPPLNSTTTAGFFSPLPGFLHFYTLMTQTEFTETDFLPLDALPITNPCLFLSKFHSHSGICLGRRFGLTDIDCMTVTLIYVSNDAKTRNHKTHKHVNTHTHNPGL